MLEIKPIFHALLRSKAGAVMLFFQIAITVAIVSNASFIIQDRISYLNQETGYPEQDIFSFALMHFGEDHDFFQQLEVDQQALRSIPGVINTVISTSTPLAGSGWASDFYLVANPDNDKGVRAGYTLSDENIIDTLGVKLIAGRNFIQADVIKQDGNSELANTVIASKAFVDEMFSSGDGLGQTIYLGADPLQIIGIVEKMKSPRLKESFADNFLIMPKVAKSSFQRMIVRTEKGQRANVMRQVEDLLLGLNNQRVIRNIKGLDESKNDNNAADILMMRMLVVLIVLLVAVTALGIFGLTVFNINKRTKQIGTRRALGARKSDIIRYFMVENALVCSVGLIIGGACAVYLGQALMTHYQIPALNIGYVFMTMFSVFVVSLLSVVFPARRAANISPSIATRSI